MSQEQENQVISYAWSVDTGGKSLNNFTGGGKESPAMPFQAPQHVGLFAFGHIYEYSAMGVTASRVGSDEGVESQCNVSMEPTRVVPLGITGITKTKFHEWLDATSQHVFSGDNFSIGTHNSVTWAEEASRVLGVRPDEEWPKYKSYYLNKILSVTLSWNAWVKRKLSEAGIKPLNVLSLKLNSLESSKRLGYATAKGASRHKWIGNTDKNCCIC